MGYDATDGKTVSDATEGGGLLVVAHWQAKEGQADRVADILSHFLPEAQRETVLLVYVEGLSYAEAAEFLGTPVGTIMSRLAAARLTLGKLRPPSQPAASTRGGK